MGQYPDRGGHWTEALVPLDGEMVELDVLLPRCAAAALEATARCQGLTTGQMVRQIIQTFLGAQDKLRLTRNAERPGPAR